MESLNAVLIFLLGATRFRFTVFLSTSPSYKLYVHLSVISHLQRGFREFGSASTKLQCSRQPATTFQDLPNQWLHLQDHLRPATQTAAATIGLHIHQISAQSVKNNLRETTMLADVDLTHFHMTHQIWWHLGLCRCSLHGGIPVLSLLGG